MDRPLDPANQKKERTQINRSKNEWGNITADIQEIQNIIKEYSKRLYFIK